MKAQVNGVSAPAWGQSGISVVRLAELPPACFLFLSDKKIR
jgi:hypothetical protein